VIPVVRTIAGFSANRIACAKIANARGRKIRHHQQRLDAERFLARLQLPPRLRSHPGVEESAATRMPI